MLQQLAQLVVNGLITGTILALTGVGATLVFGIQRIANFAHGEYLTFGAYVGLFLNVDAGQSLPVATVGAILATGLLALALHFAVLRPLRNRGLVAMSLVTVGLGLMLRDLLFMIAGPRIRQLRIDQTAVYDLGLVRISPGQLAAIIMTVVVAPASLEGSNVNAVSAMVDMITNARQFQMQTKLMSTADQNDQSANKLLEFS